MTKSTSMQFNDNSESFIRELRGSKILFLFPHPDDELYSCYKLIKELNIAKIDFSLLFLSNGVPTKKDYSPPLSLSYSYETYFKLRHNEFMVSMKSMNINKKSYRKLEIPSKKTHTKIKEIYNIIQSVIDERKINVIFSCPYEGGHPDHDVCSFLASLVRANKEILFYEYCSYFMRQGKIVAGEFKDSKENVYIIKLNDTDLSEKEKIRKIYKSQAEMLVHFRLECEIFRAKPIYDYSRRPNSEIFYESWQNKIKADDLTRKFKYYLGK